MDLNLNELDIAYDELNAVIWGYHKADPENARAQFAGVFRDYDAYIRELDAIMEAAAQAMEAGRPPEPGQVTVLPGGIDHPSGGDEGAVQTNQGGDQGCRRRSGACRP